MARVSTSQRIFLKVRIISERRGDSVKWTENERHSQVGGGNALVAIGSCLGGEFPVDRRGLGQTEQDSWEKKYTYFVRLLRITSDCKGRGAWVNGGLSGEVSALRAVTRLVGFLVLD